MQRVPDFYRVNVRVHWADTDAAGIVWFGNFLRFFEEAEDEMFRALGRTRLELVRDFGILMPRLEATCRFRSPRAPRKCWPSGIAVQELTERRSRISSRSHEHATSTVWSARAATASRASPPTRSSRATFHRRCAADEERLPTIISEQRSERRRPCPGLGLTVRLLRASRPPRTCVPDGHQRKKRQRRHR